MIYTIKHLCYAIKSSEHELDEIIANIDSYYYHTIVPKTKYGDFQRDENSGQIKYRKLTPSTKRLKNIHKKINLFLQQIQLPNYVFGAVTGKNNIKNALQHIDNTYFFSIDLKDYFSRINNKQVFNMFLQNGFSSTISKKLTQLTTYEGKLPQGPPTSPIISNLVFKETGERLLELCKIYKVIFTSYLDDLTFSSANDFKFLIPEFVNIITEGKFCINYKKVFYKKNKPEITGLIIKNKMLYLVESMRQKGIDDPSYNKYLKSYLKLIKTSLTNHRNSRNDVD